MTFSVYNAPGWVLLLVIYLITTTTSLKTTPISPLTPTPTPTPTPTCYYSSDTSLRSLVRNCSNNFINFSKSQLHDYSNLLFRMPVLTRSMMRRRDADNKSSISNSASSSWTTNILDSSSSQYQLPSSSLSLLDESVIIFENQFETSNDNNLKISNLCQLCTTSQISSQFSNMESECNDDDNIMKTEPNPPDLPPTTQDDIMKVLMAISSQMMANTQDLQGQILCNAKELQDQLSRNESKLTEEIARLKQDHEIFKQELCREVHSHQQGQCSNPQIVSPMSSSPVLPISNSSVLPQGSSQISPDTNSLLNSSTIVSTAGNNPEVFQAQMLQMLNDTFSKLSTVLVDSKIETKSEWPKFSGEISKFKDWYLGIMAQLSLPPWNLLYDPLRNDVVSSTSNSSLNGKLYAKLLVCLEGQAMKTMISRKHLRANGIMLLQELHNMYKPKNVPEVIAAKTAEFWSRMKRLNTESVDVYYTRFHTLLDEINDHRETISKSDAIRHFIFTLGNDFESIQHNYRIDNLPASWKTDDWPTLLILCRDYYNSIHPNGPPSKPSPGVGDSPFTSRQDRLDHQKKVRLWFMNPSKFKNAIETEQRKHSGKCIYHLSDTHQTSNCNVKKECDKLLSEKQVSNSTTSSTGQLRHITEESFEDAVEPDDCGDNDHDVLCNDTNEDSLQYFAKVSNHYLRLVRNTDSSPRHSMQFPIIADSGANFHMFCDSAFFDSIKPMSGKAILGDGKTALEIKGVGTIRLQFGDNVITIEDVRYVPTLAESIYWTARDFYS
jgi:hypothetical protein